MNTPATSELPKPAPIRLHSVVGGRSNPKRLTELATALHDLREWARIEASIGDDSEIAIQKVWREVMDWADGTAAKYKLNLNFECGAAAPETANIPKGDASTGNGEGERAHRSALKSPNDALCDGGPQSVESK